MLPQVLTPSSIVPQPLPPTPVIVRAGTLDDVPFLDSLQRVHTKQVGWMPRAQFEGKIKLNHVLIAEVPQAHGPAERVGYCIGNDQYFKHDDIGIIYQMNVLPGRQRGLVGATLLRAQFEKSAWGCKLYCLWCAQDIAANRFWEAMGFVPLAFRTGSEKKSRMHIFWQKRIRQGDVTTPWWFPPQTSGGSIREDRIVLLIPPGAHWSDVKPMILPGMPMSGEVKQIEDETPRPRRTKPVSPPAAAIKGRPLGGLRFSPPPPVPPPVDKGSAKPARQPKAKQKNDPRLVAAARELRDRWLEQVNATPLLPCGKYEVSRAIDDATRVEVLGRLALPSPMAA